MESIPLARPRARARPNPFSPCGGAKPCRAASMPPEAGSGTDPRRSSATTRGLPARAGGGARPSIGRAARVRQDPLKGCARPSALPARPRRGGLVLGVLAVALLAAGCGHHHHDGDVVVDNRTDLTTNEMLLTFHMAGFGDPFSADLLGGNLPVLSSRFIGSFRDGYYDAEGELELGMIVEWFDEFVGDEETTTFEVR